MFSSLGALSPSGRARTFDASADGTTLAEGRGVRRLQAARGRRARRRPDLRGDQGGRRGQRRPFPRAHRAAGGRPVPGDAARLPTGRGVTDRGRSRRGTRDRHGRRRPDRADRPDRRLPARGRPEPAAPSSAPSSPRSVTRRRRPGWPGWSRSRCRSTTASAPGLCTCAGPNPAWERRHQPVHVRHRRAPLAGTGRGPGRAVSAFGFGGANFHAVVSGHGGDVVPHRHALDAWPGELFLFRGTDRAAALTAVRSLERLLEANDAAGRPWRLRDLARTAAGWADGSAAPVRIAVVAEDLDDLAALARASRAEAPERRHRGRTVPRPRGRPRGRRRGRRRRQGRRPLPRPGQSAAGDARRPLRRLPGTPGVPPPGPRVGRPHPPAVAFTPSGRRRPRLP